MKFSCGKTSSARFYERFKKKQEWHRHFCWWPRKMTDILWDCRWLEFVDRKGKPSHSYRGGISWEWEYRPRDNYYC